MNIEDKIAILVKLGKLTFNEKDNEFEFHPNKESLFNLKKGLILYGNSIEALTDEAFAELTTADGKDALKRTE